MIRRALRSIPGWTWDKLHPWLARPGLAVRLALLAMLLSSPALLLDFHLDDHIGRYIYSDRDGAARLFHNYSGGYGLAVGDPAENHWQMEAGWAPWWHYEKLLIAAFRPVGVLLHTLDFRFLFDSPFLIHAHSLLWAGLMAAAVTRMYRALLAPAVAGAAALLFVLDHTHGFAIGHICNRHAVVATAIGALALAAHFAYGRTRQWKHAWQGPVLFIAGLLTSELTLSVAGYVFAYELLAQQDGRRKRALAVAPYVVVTLAWAAMAKTMGVGASGSGYYIDLAREPLPFAMAFLERGPLLLMGQFAGPPPELTLEVPTGVARGILTWAFVVIALVSWALLPLLRRDRIARFWGLGMVACLVPAAGADPNDRQLILASFGAMGLLAQAWHLYAHTPDGAPPWPRGSKELAGLLLAFRLFVSPALLPLMTVSVALSAPLDTSAAAFAREPVGGRDVIFVTSPYEMVVRIATLFRVLGDEHLPSHVRYLASGPQKTILRRSGPNTLEVEFEGGLLSSRQLHLHRDPRLQMPPGTTVKLEGFEVEILATSEHAGPTRARFTFDRPLEDPSLAFYRWDKRRFIPFTPPPIGEQTELPAAIMPIGFE